MKNFFRRLYFAFFGKPLITGMVVYREKLYVLYETGAIKEILNP